MAQAPFRTVLRSVRRLAGTQAADDSTDRELLQAYCSQHDAAAFAALVRRHGPMVLGVCRHVLGHEQDAEDAFQATFLVLARRPGAVRKQEALASWLHGVAHRTSRSVRRSAARRRKHEERAMARPRPEPSGNPSWREVQAVLDEEIERLPERYRAPFLLCCVEGQARSEAARQLGLKEGTLSSRLAYARKRLQQRLARRGIVLSAVLGAAALAAPAGQAASVHALAEAALRFAGPGGDVPGTISAVALRLAESTLRTLALRSLRTGAAFFLTLALLTAGAGWLTRATGEPPDRHEDPIPGVAKAPRPASPAPPRIDLHGDPLPKGALVRMGSIRLRHGDGATSVAISPDGRVVASSRRNGGPIYLWDAATGRELRRVGDDALLKGAVAFSPDGKLLAAPIFHTWLGFWDVASGREVRRITVPRGLGAISGCVAFSPDGRSVAVANSANEVCLFDVATGAEGRHYVGHEDFVLGLAFSADGKRLAAGGHDKIASVWDTATGRRLHRLVGHEGHVPCVAFAPDGQVLASCSHDRTVRLWDLNTGQELRRLTMPRKEEEVQVVFFTPDGRQVVSGSPYGVRFWDRATGQLRRSLPGMTSLVDCPVAQSRDGKLIAETGELGQVFLWDVASGKRLCVPAGHRRAVGAVRFSPDQQTLATSGWDGTIRLWETATGRERLRLSLPELGGTPVFTLDGRTLIAGGMDGQLHYWDTATGKERRRHPAHPGGAWRVRLSPDGQTLASAGQDNVLRFWDVATGQEVHNLHGPNARITDFAFSPDGKRLVSLYYDQASAAPGADGAVWFWDLETGKRLRKLGVPKCRLDTLAWSPDGRTLAAAGDDKLIHLWEVATGRERTACAGHTDWIAAVRFSPDGHMLVSTSHDATVRLWEVATGRERRCLRGHEGYVWDADFSRDGRLLATGGLDATAVVWDVSGGRAEAGPAAPLAEPELVACWTALADPDAARAYQAIKTLTRHPDQAVSLLRRHLRPVARLPEARLAALLADLDGNRFADRERALHELARLGESAEPALRAARADKPSLEARRRLDELLSRLQGPSRLRTLRAVEVLEQIGDPAARQALQVLADGSPGAQLTEEAKAAQARLAADRR
jgi:RNA polymerase sigma factor (sigma-70 family)